MKLAHCLSLLMVVGGVQARAASVKPTPTPKISLADAEMIKDLDFYQSLELIENMDQLEGEENGNAVKKK